MQTIALNRQLRSFFLRSELNLYGGMSMKWWCVMSVKSPGSNETLRTGQCTWIYLIYNSVAHFAVLPPRLWRGNNSGSNQVSSDVLAIHNKCRKLMFLRQKYCSFYDKRGRDKGQIGRGKEREERKRKEEENKR